jgi:hypothetical protein
MGIEDKKLQPRFPAAGRCVNLHQATRLFKADSAIHRVDKVLKAV